MSSIRTNGPFRVKRGGLSAQGLVAWVPLAARRPREAYLAGAWSPSAVTLSATPPVYFGDPLTGSALLFNGNALSLACDLSPYAVVGLSVWLNWLTFGNDDHLAFEYSPNYNNTSGLLVDPNRSVAPVTFGFGMSRFSGSATYWLDQFARPSAVAWHHYLLIFDRTTPLNTAYVDGVLQTLTTETHSMAGGSAFASNTLYMMGRNLVTLLADGRMADVRVYDMSAVSMTYGQLAWHMFDPATRWDLYQLPKARPWSATGDVVAFTYPQLERGVRGLERGVAT